MPSNHIHQWLRTGLGRGALGVIALLVAFLPTVPTSAAPATDTDFNVQVAPSPLVLTLVPGQTQTATISVRNFSNHTETLKPTLKGFSLNSDSNNVVLNDNVPADMNSWVTFKQPLLAIDAGQSQQLGITFNTPTNVGFNYSLAITLNRVSSNGSLDGPGAHVKANIAVFCLINIDRPGATAKLNISAFTSDRSHYNFLPVVFSTTVKNGGNVIEQPSGTIFIQRSFSDPKPLATIPINPTGGYVLPGISRTFSTSWRDGFPLYISTAADGRTSVHLQWDWKHLSDFRVGRYVAKAVMVYNDGHQDVPVIASTTFWVIPWWLLLTGLVVITVLATGLVGWGRLIFKGTRKVKGYANRSHKD